MGVTVRCQPLRQHWSVSCGQHGKLRGSPKLVADIAFFELRLASIALRQIPQSVIFGA